MPHFPSPSALTNEELIRYSDISLAQGIALPLTWQEELTKRLEMVASRSGQLDSRRPSHPI
jgi:hypothetical protein